MSRAWVTIVAFSVSLAASPALAAADCEAVLRPKVDAALGAAPSATTVKAYLSRLMDVPRYFEQSCDRPQLDHPLYPGIPVRACNYEYMGLQGWALLANPGPDLAAGWIHNACADQADVRTCLVRLTAYTWCSNQLSFPVVGNIIEPASSGGGAGDQPENFAFLHGVTIKRPDWMPARSSVNLGTQRQKFLALVANKRSYRGPVAQVSRPSGVRQDVYVKYGLGGADLQAGDLGRSCPPEARRPEWLSLSRILYNRSWRTGRSPMFRAAAKALMAGEPPGRVAC